MEVWDQTKLNEGLYCLYCLNRFEVGFLGLANTSLSPHHLSQRNQTCPVGLASTRQPWGEPTWKVRRLLKVVMALAAVTACPVATVRAAMSAQPGCDLTWHFCFSETASPDHPYYRLSSRPPTILILPGVVGTNRPSPCPA